MGRYKTQHTERQREEQAEERAHELEEAVNRAPIKRRASTASVSPFFSLARSHLPLKVNRHAEIS